MTQFDPNSTLHVVNKGGRKFITFVGLQAKLVDQEKFVKSIHFRDLLFPWDNPYHLYRCKATIVVVNKEGVEAEYQATGDAGIHKPSEGEQYKEAIDNVGSMVQPHFFRMAETRAVVRAMRFATRSEYTAAEEV